MSADTRPRCEAQVNRYQFSSNPEEAEFALETCGRLAKAVVQVGTRAVQTCGVHERRLRQLAGLGPGR